MTRHPISDSRVSTASEPADAHLVRTIDLPDAELSPDESRPVHMPHRTLDLVGDIEVTLDVRLGTTVMPIDNLMKLSQGAVLELDRHLGESVDVLLNNRSIARGAIVAVGENFGIQITEIVDETHGAV